MTVNSLPPSHPIRSAYVAPRLCTEPKAAEGVVAAIVSAEVLHNDTKGAPAVDDMTAFHALEAPSIHVRDYVHRLASYSFSSTACLLAAVHYVKRAVGKDPRLAPTSLSVHRLLITALVLAAKFFDDVTYSMSYYAKVGGLPVKELAYLELKLLALLDFRLHIPAHAFHSLECDLADALCYIPRSGIVTEASRLIRSTRVDLRREIYSESFHPDDQIGFWYQHPAPNAHVLTSLDAVCTPCSTPPRSHSPAHSQAMRSSLVSVPSYCSEGNGPLNRYGSNVSAVTVEGAYDRRRRYGPVDEGSGPLSRFSSATSTITSEGSGSEVSTMDDTPKWTGGQVQAQVYCRFGGPVSREQQWEGGQPQFEAEVRAALSS